MTKHLDVEVRVRFDLVAAGRVNSITVSTTGEYFDSKEFRNAFKECGMNAGRIRDTDKELVLEIVVPTGMSPDDSDSAIKMAEDTLYNTITSDMGWRKSDFKFIQSRAIVVNR